MTIQAIDLFCGAGGLTRGLELEGINVQAGFDIDAACRYVYEANNWSTFVEADVAKLSTIEIGKYWTGDEPRLLAGCAPCQPFSKYTQALSKESDGRWGLLEYFGRLAAETKPELITMENVPDLRKHVVHARFVEALMKAGYFVSETIVECEQYGIPQKRRRLVLLASLLGPIELIAPASFGAVTKTVRETIGDLRPLNQGAVDPNDSLHRASSLSPLNLKRIRQSLPGGSWADWDDNIVADCHRRTKGKGYRSVYGRMVWDEPSPTITTQSYGFGSGRFGHPTQDRALSLREAALLQTFPRDYAFVPPGAKTSLKTLGRLIGNAVPVQLGCVVGRTLVQHVAQHSKNRRCGDRRPNTTTLACS